MADAIAIRVEPVLVQVKPGAQISANITIRNRTEEVGHYLLSVEGLPAGWADIVPDQISAFPMQDIPSKIVIHPPIGTRGATYHAAIRAISQENTAIEVRGNLDIEVPAPVATAPDGPPRTLPETRGSGDAQPTAGASIAQTARNQTAAQIEINAELLKDSKLPPPAVQWRLSLHNAGGVIDTFAFSITGVKAAWVRLEPAQLTLKADERSTALLTITPAPDTPSGTYPLVLRTFSHLNMKQRTELPLKFEVRPAAGFQLSIDPKDAESQGQRDFRVILASSPTSNTDLVLNLSASDQDNACDYTFEQSQVSVPAKQTVVSTMRARPRTARGPNERKMYTIKVTATERSGVVPPQSVEARLTQVAAAPLRLVLHPQVLGGELEADFGLQAINPSGVDASVVLSGDDPEGACEFVFTPVRLTLPAGVESQAKVKVKARSNFEGEGQKEYPFTISATRVGELEPMATAQGRFQQKQLRPVTLTLIPPQLSSTGGASYIVRASNPRTRSVQVLLSAQDEADALAFTFKPSEINLSAGAEGSSTLSTRPKDHLMKGEQRRVHKFVVTGTVDGAATPPTAKGTLAQIPGLDLTGPTGTSLKLTVWILRWLAVLLVLLFLVTQLLAGIEVFEADCRVLLKGGSTVILASQAGGRELASEQDQKACRNVRLVQAMLSVMPQQGIATLVDLSPFAGITRGIAREILHFVNLVTGWSPSPP
jgi:hypothetical protein